MLYIRPAAVLTHDPPHEGWAVLADGDRIVAAGPHAEVPHPPGTREVPAEGLLLAPGMLAGMVLLTPDLRVAATIVRGEVVYTAP